MRLATSCEWRIDMYTVYMHRNKINGKIYIGITGKSPEVRWQNGNGYSQRHFGRAIKKYGWENFDHIILFTGLTKEEACQKEIELIEKYDATNSDKGYNIAKGGEINCGYHISEERKKHLSELNKGERHPQYHKPKSDITRKRMSEARKGKPFSEKHRKHLSEARKGIPAPNRRPVNQYDLSMNFIKHFDSMEDAQNELHINKANICRAIKYDRTAGGYKWTY